MFFDSRRSNKTGTPQGSGEFASLGKCQADAESSIPFREDEDDNQEPPPHGWILNPDGALGDDGRF